MLDTLTTAVSQGYAGLSEACKRVYHSPWNVNLTLENTLGERPAQWVKDNPKKAQGISDTATLIAYGFTIGTMFDTSVAHLTPEGWLGARAISLGANGIVSAPYGIWTNFIYRKFSTTKESSQLRKIATDLFAFITGQSVPVFGIYAGATFIESGEINWSKIGAAMLGFVLYSPLAGPTMNWTMRKGREYCGLPTAGHVTGTLSPKCQSCKEQSPAPASLTG